ncbi:hypothetical protein SUGI_0251720 [Cryptomeria japonica]|nr:hypothetical protein SUGI_0251720 [Cryptomeria japonica]
MVAAWAWQIGKSSEKVKWLLKEIVDDEWLLNLDQLVLTALPGLGFEVRKREPGRGRPTFFPFRRWEVGTDLKARSAETTLGWTMLEMWLIERKKVDEGMSGGAGEVGGEGMSGGASEARGEGMPGGAGEVAGEGTSGGAVEAGGTYDIGYWYDIPEVPEESDDNEDYIPSPKQKKRMRD